MPTYNYKCNDCGYTFTVVQKMSDSPVSSCELCHGRVNRVISGGTGLIFKGTGFYLTDYARKKHSEVSNTDNKVESPKTKSDKKEQKTKGITDDKN
ncbi:MAG: FmdB family zinc ribbon protein [Fidelibacterota bacterium]